MDCVLTAWSLYSVQTCRADTVVVTADRMVDVLAGRTVMRPQITITDGRITAVTSQDAPAAPGARRINLPGMTLLPGLIDMHVHLTSDPRFSGYKYLQFTDNFWTVVGVANAKRTLEAGFTTVRNVGSYNFDDVALKQGIEQGYIPGRALVPATHATARQAALRFHRFRLRLRQRPPHREWPGGLRAMVRKLRACGSHQVLRHRWRDVRDGYRGRQQSPRGNEGDVDEAHMLEVAVHAHGTSESRTRCGQASTPLSTPVWPTMKPRAGQAAGTYFDIADIYTTTRIPPPRARRTARSRNRWK
jgi:imidazolonepropionase-like amidohydrolase